jgi:hypothetical protein
MRPRTTAYLKGTFTMQGPERKQRERPEFKGALGIYRGSWRTGEMHCGTHETEQRDSRD